MFCLMALTHAVLAVLVQGMHEEEPRVAVNELRGHVEHDELPATAENEPSAQGEHEPEEAACEKVPAGQSLQEAPLGENLPMEQAPQAVPEPAALVTGSEPTAQPVETQLVLPEIGWVVPTGHAEQTVAAAALPKVSGGQFAHEVKPNLSAKEPAAQSLQMLAPVWSAYFPRGQLMHEVCELEFWKRPTGHLSQVLTEVANEPAPQVTCVEDVSHETWPAAGCVEGVGHCVQVVEPVADCTVPPGQR